MALKFYKSFDIKEKDFDELFCTECTRNGRSVDTLNFCVGCESLFCFQCLQDHRQADAESMLDDDINKTSYENNQHSLLENNNNNNRYNGYTKYSYKLTELKQNLLSLHKQLHNHTEYDRAESEKRLQKVKEQVDRKITDLKTKVNDWLDELQSKVAEEVRDFHNEIEKSYSEKTMSVKILMIKTDATLEKLQGAKSKTDIDDVTSFIEQTRSEAMRIFEDPDNYYASILKKITTAEIDNANAIFTDSVEELLGNINALGKSLIEDNSSEITEAICKFYDVEGPTDTSVCDINGSCIMPDGSILLTDWNNTNIKHLNQRYQVRDTCALPGIPWAICCTGRKEVAVSLHFLQRIQFVSLCENKLELTDSFKVRQQCRGVACADNKIYVSCGGGGILEGKGQVHVYTREGALLEAFKLDSVGNNLFSCPQHLTISEDGSVLYIADKNTGVVTIDLHKKIPAEAHTRAIGSKPEEAKGICLTGDSDIILCDFILHTVAVYNNTVGGFTGFQTLLDREDDICNPQSVCYNSKKKELVVTSGNTNFIQVFQMERKQ